MPFRAPSIASSFAVSAPGRVRSLATTASSVSIGRGETDLRAGEDEDAVVEDHRLGVVLHRRGGRLALDLGLQRGQAGALVGDELREGVPVSGLDLLRRGEAGLELLECVEPLVDAGGDGVPGRLEGRGPRGRPGRRLGGAGGARDQDGAQDGGQEVLMSRVRAIRVRFTVSVPLSLRRRPAGRRRTAAGPPGRAAGRRLSPPAARRGVLRRGRLGRDRGRALVAPVLAFLPPAAAGEQQRGREHDGDGSSHGGHGVSRG